MRDLFGVLIRHFFGRFFDNELVSTQGEVHATLSKVIGLLAAPGLICFWLMPKYTMLVFVPPKVAEAASLSDKMFFITFSIAVMGFVTVLEWDALFPDRRDFTILIPLPINLPSIFAAKIVSLCAFVVMFFVATNAIHTFLYPFVAMGRYAVFLGVLGAMGVHATVMLAATSCTFFFFVALQGVLMNVLSFRAFRRVSIYVQLLAVLALLMMLLLFLDTSSLIHSAKNRQLLYFFPPMWFLGLYETMLGQPEPLAGCREIALQALGWVLIASALSYALSYKRHVKRSLESEEILDVVPSRASTLLCAFANRYIVPNPLEQASFYFTGKTMVRSRKHWLYLAAYVGVGFALMLQALVDWQPRHRYAQSFAAVHPSNHFFFRAVGNARDFRNPGGIEGELGVPTFGGRRPQRMPFRREKSHVRFRSPAFVCGSGADLCFPVGLAGGALSHLLRHRALLAVDRIAAGEVPSNPVHLLLPSGKIQHHRALVRVLAGFRHLRL
jgi:hypothetical protein